MTNKSPLNGWLILDKPSGISSAKAVARVKHILTSPERGEVAEHSEAGGGELFAKENTPTLTLPPNGGGKLKIGHAGTLDPLASGVLPLALGEATKTVSYMMDAGKAYSFTVQWGAQTTTDDSEGEIIKTSDKCPSDKEISDILPLFTGHIEQAPPAYSAIKVDGKRAYALARGGEEVELKARTVRVDSLELLTSPERGEVAERSEAGGGNLDKNNTPSLTLPPNGGGNLFSTFLCHCGKGTYIRSLARDMGAKLGCYGHITALRRIKVGKFEENHAISLEFLEEMVHKGDLSFLLAVESALDDIPALEITSSQAALLRQGRFLSIPAISSEILLAKCGGLPVAICAAAEGQIKPVRVFNVSE